MAGTSPPDVSGRLREGQPPPDFVVYLDESVVDLWGSDSDNEDPKKTGKRAFVGAVVTPRESGLITAVAECHEELLANPTHWSFRGADHRLQRSAREGLHFTADSDHMKQTAVSVMARQDFRAHIYHADLEPSGLTSEDLQAVMYFNLLRTLMVRYAGLRVALVFENCQSMNGRFGRIVSYAARSLDRPSRHESSRPRALVTAALGYKPCGGLSTIDYCLGIANLQLQSERSDGEKPVQRFQLEMVSKLNPNIAHVVDFGSVVHRTRFPILERPRWAEDILGASSPSIANRPFSTLISSSPTGPFSHRHTTHLLASTLGLTDEQLKDAVRLAGQGSSYEFRSLTRKGKARTFVSPKEPLLALAQKRTADFLRPLNEFLHPSCVGYVPGRRTLDAASPHSGKRWIQKLDIADYYGSTSHQLIHRTFLSMGAAEVVAETLATLVTWEGTLPTGTRTSPVVSNLVLADFDFACADEATHRGIAYTRYADDLVFSSDQPFDMLDWVAERLSTLGYELNPDKSQLRSRGQPVRVAGLTVFETDKPRLPKSLKRRLRLEIFLVDKDVYNGVFNLSAQEDGDVPPEVADAVKRLTHARGMIRYCRGVEPLFVEAVLAPYGSELRSLLRPARQTQRDQLEMRRVLRNIDNTGPIRLSKTAIPVPAQTVARLEGGTSA